MKLTIVVTDETPGFVYGDETKIAEIDSTDLAAVLRLLYTEYFPPDEYNELHRGFANLEQALIYVNHREGLPTRYPYRHEPSRGSEQSVEGGPEGSSV